MTGADIIAETTRLPTRAAKGARRPVQCAIAGIAPETQRQLGRGFPWLLTGAVEVERLLTWAYGEQRVEANPVVGLLPIEAAAAGYQIARPSPDGCYAIDQRHTLGAQIDTSGGPAKETSNPVALAVADAVSKSDEANLVRHWSRIGSRPDGWQEPTRWIVPRAWKADGETAEWEHGGANGKIIFTPVRLARSAESIDFDRATYARWHAALISLWMELSHRALGFIVLPPVAPAEPWKDEQ
jgi:hypothetical protein